ncbi:TonB family protein [Myxococcota bacterium]|nr:TonB family protein [Myxococcota bacterium]
MGTGRSGKQAPRRGLAIGLACSLLIHGLLVLFLGLHPPTPPTPEEKQAVRMRILDRAKRAGPAAAPLEGQVVDLPPPDREEAPPEARFLGRYDRRVDRERKARRSPGAEAGPSSFPGRSAAAARKAEKPSSPGEGSPEAADTVSRGADDGRGHRILAGLDRLRGVGQGPAWGSGGPGDEGFGDGGPAGVVTGDAFLGVPEEGDTTLVNTRSFKYWDFFQRVKERVRSQWNPGPLYSARDPDGRLYGRRDRLTILAVALDASGRILRTELKRESGLPFLDDEAIRAFQKAGPFPNPPAGLVDDQGRIVFTFGFLLEVGASEGRFFWSRPR